jgi:hypothetical protein
MKRVIKMVLESYQLMSNAMWANGATGFYKKTHANHPCSLWTAESRDNFGWLLEHACALASRYTDAYGKIHKSMEHYYTCRDFLSSGSFPQDSRTPFVNCTTFKGEADVHVAYKKQLLEKWRNDASRVDNTQQFDMFIDIFFPEEASNTNA